MKKLTPLHEKNIIAEMTWIGPDRKGVVAAVTRFVFEQGGNIEGINQNVVRGLFAMHLTVSFPPKKNLHNSLPRLLRALAQQLKMEVQLHLEEPARKKRMVLFVTKEQSCPELLLKAHTTKRLQCEIPLIIGTEPTLAPLAHDYGVPFIHIEHKTQSAAEEKLLQHVAEVNGDFIVLARYMRILTPNFVWRYPNRIINIHPSLLPAFAGASAYVQAYERGARIVGVTAHFVTEELDQGPIITQNAFKLDPEESLESIRQRGQEQEAKTLLEAVELYLTGRLKVEWNRVKRIA